MFEGTNFESDRLITRELFDSDAEELFRIYSDKEAMQYRGAAVMVRIEDAYKMIANQSLKEGNLLRKRLGIISKSNGQLIGTLLLTRNKSTIEECEIGFSFGKRNWGRGLGKETLEMLELQLRNIEGIEIIKAWVVKENVASIHIFEKAQFIAMQQTEYPKSNLYCKRLKE